ncbi:muscleblind-like protein 1 [Sycon ciliatum]|uniref:muscleblind-like protein 1 n=1 Tax=Sycon ciliatum TaxID=27933 RepID=UPI0020A93D51|eukprot:scpid81179/ scgid24453/ Zinc finger CCCH domain-containing protein 10
MTCLKLPMSRQRMSAQDKGFCRDFLHGSCDRVHCRFVHASIAELMVMGEDVGRLIFCRDFQENRCDRVNCRFLHASKDDEEFFRRYQTLPQYLMYSLPEHVQQLFRRAALAHPVVNVPQMVPQVYYQPQTAQTPLPSLLHVLQAPLAFMPNLQQQYAGMPMGAAMGGVQLTPAVMPVAGSPLNPFGYP